MKVSKNLGGITIHAEGENIRALFAELANLEEIFSIQACARCQSAVKHVHRVVDENNFYEVQCVDWKKCGAKLRFGSTKKGHNLFPGKTNKETGKVERKWETMAEIKARTQ